MKKAVRLIKIFIVLLFSINALAATEKGNGGDVIVCPSNNTAELLDHYEARTIYARTLNMGPGTSWQEMVNFAVARLARLSPIRTAEYTELAKSFLSSVEFTDQELPDIPDSKETLLPKGCQLRQAAIQDMSDPLRPKYRVNRLLWDALTELGKAGLVLHEIIYHEARSADHLDSRAARAFNGILSSKDIESMSVQNYIDYLKVLNFKWNDFGVYKSAFKWGPLYYPAGGGLAHVFLSECSWAQIPTQTTYIKNQIDFFENGHVSKTYFCEPTVVKFLGQVIQAHNKITFFDSGDIESLELPVRTNLKIGEIKADFVDQIKIDKSQKILMAKHFGGFTLQPTPNLTFDFKHNEDLKELEWSGQSNDNLNVKGASGHFHFLNQDLELAVAEHSSNATEYNLVISENTPITFLKHIYSAALINVKEGHLRDMRLRKPADFKIKASSTVKVNQICFRENGSVEYISLAFDQKIKFGNGKSCLVKGGIFGDCRYNSLKDLWSGAMIAISEDGKAVFNKWVPVTSSDCR